MTAANTEDLLGGKKAPAKDKTETKGKAEAKPAAKKAADKPAKDAKPEAKAAPAKKAAKATEDLLGGKSDKKAAPAKKAPKAEAADKPKRERAAKEPVTFVEGEREELIAKIKKMVKKPINSRELAPKLDIDTRKLRAVLYSAQRAGIISLELAGSRVEGMTVSPAVA